MSSAAHLLLSPQTIFREMSMSRMLAYAVIMLAALVMAAMVDAPWVFWFSTAILFLHAVRFASVRRARKLNKCSKFPDS